MSEVVNEAAPMTEAPAGEVKKEGGGFRRRPGRGGRGRGRGSGRGEGGRGANDDSKTCYNCGQSGHLARFCENPRLEGEERKVINSSRAQFRRCFNCGKTGHVSADCPAPAGNKSCYSCGGEGHIARDCPNPGTAE